MREFFLIMLCVDLFAFIGTKVSKYTDNITLYGIFTVFRATTALTICILVILNLCGIIVI